MKGCTARLFVRDDHTAYRDRERKHLQSHGNQYQDYKLMYCDNRMKQRDISAPASMTPYDIYIYGSSSRVSFFLYSILFIAQISFYQLH